MVLVNSKGRVYFTRNFLSTFFINSDPNLTQTLMVPKKKEVVSVTLLNVHEKNNSIREQRMSTHLSILELRFYIF